MARRMTLHPNNIDFGEHDCQGLALKRCPTCRYTALNAIGKAGMMHFMCDPAKVRFHFSNLILNAGSDQPININVQNIWIFCLTWKALKKAYNHFVNQMLSPFLCPILLYYNECESPNLRQTVDESNSAKPKFVQ